MPVDEIVMKKSSRVVLSVSYVSEEGFLVIIFDYFDNFKHSGSQTLIENLNRVESSLQKSRIITIL